VLNTPFASAQNIAIVETEGQPLAANVQRVLETFALLGRPLERDLHRALTDACRARDASRIQSLIDPQALLVASLNPEVRVKLARGPAPAVLQQGGYTPVLIKVINHSTTTAPLNLSSPQAGPVYAGVAKLSMERQRQEHLRVNENTDARDDRFLDLEVFARPPMTPQLSGLEVEYVIALLYSSEAGRREATLVCDVGQGTQDLGFRAEVPVLFNVQPAVEVKLSVRDHDGKPTMGKFEFHDEHGHVYPPQPKRLAPDFFFQRHIYRADGETVLLPPGKLTMLSSRGPEYVTSSREVTVRPSRSAKLDIRLSRWIDPGKFGFYSGDHHIHAAGCAHYTSPTEGVLPEHMFRQVKGEGLNVGCVLTWGPCFDYQQQFFEPKPKDLRDRLTLMKYDIEVSGFGSQALGHVCLLNLKEQIYPGANGSKGWPTWTTPVLRWAKSQGAVTGYAHSGSGLQVNPAAAAKRLLDARDQDADGRLSRAEAEAGLLPAAFGTLDANHDGLLTERELTQGIDRVADELPNLAIPELNSVGAQEIFVTVAQGLCDFISAMDTARLLEWNCWYHLLNCGFPLKVSGETDFPCMSSTRVGQGRVYVQLGRVDELNFDAWCEGLRAGRSYVSDGYAHAVEFRVADAPPGDTVRLDRPGQVKVRAKVAFGSQTPVEAAYGGVMPAGGMRLMGDTVNLHETAGPGVFADGRRNVELIVNGLPVASQAVPADDRVHELEFDVALDRSSWVALRHFPQLHTNPVNVLVGGAPIRASRDSALWAIECIDQLWRVRERAIAPSERAAAKETFERAKILYRRIASESTDH
jgi:hypothetical protein